MLLDIKISCSFQILELQPSTDVDVVMLCFGLMHHPPQIYQSRSQ